MAIFVQHMIRSLMPRVVFVLFLAPIMSTTFGYGANVHNVPSLTRSVMFPVVTRPIPIADNRDPDTNKVVSRFSKAAVALGIVVVFAVSFYFLYDGLHEVPQHTSLPNVTLNDSLVRNVSASPKPFATAIPTPAITPGIPPLPSAPGTVSAATFTALPPATTTASVAPTTDAQSQNCKDYADYLDRNAVAARYLRPNISCAVQDLLLDNRNIGPDQMDALTPALQYLINLKTLSLNHNPMKDSGVITLASALGTFRGLTTLSLSYTNIGREGIVALGTALAGRAVSTLCLDHNQIDDIGISSLASAMPSIPLKYVYLNNNNITNGGAHALKSVWQAMLTAKQPVPQVCSLEENFITTGEKLELKKIFLNINFGW